MSSAILELTMSKYPSTRGVNIMVQFQFWPTTANFLLRPQHLRTFHHFLIYDDGFLRLRPRQAKLSP